MNWISKISQSLPQSLATLFILGALATIPYAAPVASWYMGSLTILAVTCVLTARFDPHNRWQSVTIWPIFALLGAWAIAIAASTSPQVSFARSASMALFSMLFIAVQVAAWNARALRIVLVAVAATVLATVADVAWQKWTGKSLILGIDGDASGYAGSQGNRNDLALISILLPLCSTLLSGTSAIILYTILAAVASLGWILSASRQTAIGWVIAFIGPFVARVSRKTILLTITIALIASGVMVYAVAPLRARANETWNNGWDDRQEIAAFGVYLFWQSPLTGVGPGMYGTHYRIAAMKEWSFNGRKLPQVGMPWVHSLPVEVLCETGAVGAAAVAVIVAATFRRLRRGFASTGTTRDLAVAVATSLLALAVIGLVDLTLIKDWVRCVWWLLLGLAFVSPIQVFQAKTQSKASSKYKSHTQI